MTDHIIKNREGSYVSSGKAQKNALRYLYNTVSGRAVLKLLVRPSVSRVAGRVMDSRVSAVAIKPVIKKQEINSEDFLKSKYHSYNDFFTRQIKPEKRLIDMAPAALISPCDSKLAVYQLDENSYFRIKDSVYTVRDLLGGAKLASEYKNGICMIFRLTVEDYHRYCYFDEGKKGRNVFIQGMLHTVNPVVLGKYNIYKRNSREYTVMYTKNFGKAVQIEVGAMLVGKIKNHHGAHAFKRGEEKGMFEFGGSTIVLLLKENAAAIDGDILENSANNIETVVRMGERIGTSLVITANTEACLARP